MFGTKKDRGGEKVARVTKIYFNNIFPHTFLLYSLPKHENASADAS